MVALQLSIHSHPVPQNASPFIGCLFAIFTFLITSAQNLITELDHILICTQPHCTVVCDTQYMCNNITIDGTNSDSIEITCSAQYSCSEIIMIGSGGTMVNVYCTKNMACSDSYFDFENSVNVIFHCSYDFSCYEMQINAILSANLTVECTAEKSCYEMTIYCPSNAGLCSMSCIENSCRYNYIHVTNCTELKLDCIEHPYDMFCDDIQLYCGVSSYTDILNEPNNYSGYYEPYDWQQQSSNNVVPVNSITYDARLKFIAPKDYNHYTCSEDKWILASHSIDCDNQGSVCVIDCTTKDCFNYVINGSAVTTSLTVFCGCDMNNTDTLMGCVSATIICPTKIGSSCTINCLTQGTCEEIIIAASYAYSVHVNCAGTHACQYMMLNAANAYYLSLNCTPYHTDPVCGNSVVYCPAHSAKVCDIDCITHYENNNQICTNMVIRVNDSYSCDYLSLSSELGFEYPTNISVQCDGKLETILKSEYYCKHQSSKYCCPWCESITCIVDECSVDCADKGSQRCKETIINGTKSQSLFLNCDETNTCENSIIYCGTKICNISCMAESCHGLAIHANETSNFTISCKDSNSCYEMIIYAHNCSYFTFNANAVVTVIIYAENTKSLDIYCEAFCNNMQIYANNTDSVTVTATNKYSFNSNMLYASAAGRVSIICPAVLNGYSCFNNQWFLPKNLNTVFIYCYGNGCKYFGRIYLHSSISSIALYVNGCDQCKSPSTCVINCTVDLQDVMYDCLQFAVTKFTNDDHDSYCLETNYKLLNKLRYDLLWPLLVAVAIILVIFIYSAIKYMNRFIVDKVLVLIIGITQFDDENLPNLSSDKSNIFKLDQLWRDIYQYEVFICNKDASYCTKADVISFIDEHMERLNNKSYKGVVVHILTHGQNNEQFITSDMKLMELDFICYELNEASISNSSLIKIIHFHACRGSQIYHDEFDISNEQSKDTTCCCCPFNTDYSNNLCEEMQRNETNNELQLATYKPLEPKYRTSNSNMNHSGGEISEQSNCIIIYQNVKDRSNSVTGYFTNCIYNSFEKNAKKCIQKNLITLIKDIARDLEQVTKKAEILTTSGIGTLRYDSIIMKPATKKIENSKPLLLTE
eukprot:32771_1